MKHSRPRSADLGGLHLATAGSGFGQGWLGYSCQLHTRFAELLSDMYNETLNAVNERDAEFATTDLPVETRVRLIQSLDSWNFEPHKLPDEEVLSCTMILFEALFRVEGMHESVGIQLGQIYPLIHHLRRIYRWENTYHNFEHALDVLQASYTFLRLAGVVPSVKILLDDDSPTWKASHSFDNGHFMTCLRPQDLFVIYIAAIGHDVAHPGFTNVFMKNAQAPLSLVFDNKSPLEQMHVSLLLRVMRHHGLGPLLDDPTDNSGARMRKLLSETVLATDMNVHNTFMENFKSLLSGKGEADLCTRQVLICQAIIKCADISNPYRPFDVAKHWAAALKREWTSQAMLEQCMHLPTTVQASNDPLSEAKGQIFFITAFAKPLLEVTVEAVPELDPLLDQCKSNLQVWKSRQIELENEIQVNTAETSPNSSGTSRRDDYLTVFPLTLPALHPYRSMVQLHTSISLDQLTAEQNRNQTDDEGEANDDFGSASSAVLTGTTLIWPSSANAGGVYRGKSDEDTPSSYESSAESIPCSPTTDSASESGSCLFSPSAVGSGSGASGSTSGSAGYAPSNALQGPGNPEGPSSSASSGRGSSPRSRANSAISESDYGAPIAKFLPSHFNFKPRNGTASSYRSGSVQNGHRSSDSTCSTTASRETFAAHAAIRAAADSAGAGLRKKRSMLNRNSWSPSVFQTQPKEGGNTPNSKGSDFATLSVPIPPPPMTSSAAFTERASVSAIPVGQLGV